MVIVRFPPVELADESGLLALGGDLEPESLLLAYRSGIFPWPYDDRTLTWFAPRTRALLRFDSLHVSRSLRKELRRRRFRVMLNTRFPEVIRRCSEVVNRGRQHGTWITDEMIDAYIELNRLGYAHSAEAFLDGELVGGLYGISIGRMFAGESMFFREDNASKVAFVTLVRHLQREGGEWIDCQVATPHMLAFGAREIPQNDFTILLSDAVAKPPMRFEPMEITLPEGFES